MNEREYIIAKAKELGVTAEEMGFVRNEVQIPVKDEQFIHEVSQMIIGMDIKEEARENINEKYWDDLGIRPEKRYKVVRCRMKKEIYKNIDVVIPEDEDDDAAENYIEYLENLDNDCPDDEEEWECDYVSRSNGQTYTAKEIDYAFNTDNIWNYDDFDNQ